MSSLCTMRFLPEKYLAMHRSDRTVDRIMLVGQSLHVVANDGRCLQVYKFKNYNIICLFITNQLLGQLVGANQMAVAHSHNPCESPKSISFTAVY